LLRASVVDHENEIERPSLGFDVYWVGGIRHAVTHLAVECTRTNGDGRPELDGPQSTYGNTGSGGYGFARSGWDDPLHSAAFGSGLVNDVVVVGGRLNVARSAC
jgi:hypothetical protein